MAGDLTGGMVDDAFIVSFDQLLAADDAAITVEFTSDLVTWIPASADQLRSLTNNGDGTATQVWASADPVSASSPQFVRVAVSLR